MPTVRAMIVATGTPPAPQRVESDVSATITSRAVLSCSCSRVTSGAKFVSVDCAQSMADGRSPGCQSRRPAGSWPAPRNALGWAPAACSRMRRTMTSSMSWISSQPTRASLGSGVGVGGGGAVTGWAPAR